MTQEVWWRCDGCGKVIESPFINSEPNPLANWVRIDLEIKAIEGKFEKVTLRPTCCSTACVGLFFEKYAKEFEGQVELFGGAA